MIKLILVLMAIFVVGAIALAVVEAWRMSIITREKDKDE